jgi:hypothetical protein
VTASVLSTPGTVSTGSFSSGALTRAGSALRRPGRRRQAPPRRVRAAAPVRPQRLTAAPGAPLALAAALLLLAVLLAPEQPQVQEAICHRHSGVAACRVW